MESVIRIYASAFEVTRETLPLGGWSDSPRHYPTGRTFIHFTDPWGRERNETRYRGDVTVEIVCPNHVELVRP